MCKLQRRVLRRIAFWGLLFLVTGPVLVTSGSSQEDTSTAAKEEFHDGETTSVPPPPPPSSTPSSSSASPKDDTADENDDDDDDDDDDAPSLSRGLVIVASEEGWRRGRVEETQLLASAEKHNYQIKIQNDDGIPCKKITEGDIEQDYLLVFLPRAEGIIAGSTKVLEKSLKEASARIILPPANVNALIGRSNAIRSAAKALGVTSLASLSQLLRRSSKLREQHIAKIDNEGRVTYVLNDDSNLMQEGLEIAMKDGHYELQVNGHTPSIVLASPESNHGRALLLAVSDYLVGSQHPEEGCLSCRTVDDRFAVNVSHKVVVGLFISKPQPFLEEVIGALVRHGLKGSKTHFFIYNQVQEYNKQVEIFIERLQIDGEVNDITFMQASGQSPDIANVKNMAMRECKRLQCKWYVNIDTDAFINPNVIAIILSLGHTVIAPAFRVQTGMPATFWREIDAAALTPTYSWDHEKILNYTQSMRGYWHSSCLRGFYAIRHDVLEKLSEPYSHTHKVPKNSPYPDADLAFCAALREEGIAMVATNAFPNTGTLLNTTRYAMKGNLFEYQSNPIMWTVSYIHRDLRNLMAGDFSLVKRPCHDVYEFPVFNSLFGFDLIALANKVRRWSPALKKDPRKKFGVEPVPTVDQWFSQLGVRELFDKIFDDILLQLQKIAFPFSNPGVIASNSLVARFKPDEVPGLPNHHDSSILTFYLNLTPKENYQGGEVEFPQQNCKVKSEAGHLLVFPSRLTHPKVFHNVTKGVLHKAIFFIHERLKEEEDEIAADNKH